MHRSNYNHSRMAWDKKKLQKCNVTHVKTGYKLWLP